MNISIGNMLNGSDSSFKDRFKLSWGFYLEFNFTNYFNNWRCYLKQVVNQLIIYTVSVFYQIMHFNCCNKHYLQGDAGVMSM